ncbi:hypothetical protein LTS16_016948, partial [Friedmanniomyces endolithicus]
VKATRRMLFRTAGGTRRRTKPACAQEARAPATYTAARLLTLSSKQAESLGTPPLDVARDRSPERKTCSKTGKREVRRQVEPDESPWNRRIGCVKQKGVPASLGHQRLQSARAAVVRSHNAPIILEIDKGLGEFAEKQKTTRVRKNGGAPTASHVSSSFRDVDRRKAMEFHFKTLTIFSTRLNGLHERRERQRQGTQYQERAG